MKRVVLCVLAVVMIFGAASCDIFGGGDENSSQQREASSRQSSYDALVDGQPSSRMDYSPTREAINFWINTWDEPGKLSFVYLIASNGENVGYFVFEGLPVTYCAALTPTYEFVRQGNGVDPDSSHVVPAPSVDGVYYSGGQCTQYYGKDASTGAYLEFSTGNGLNFFVSEEPLDIDTQPLGPTTADEAGRLN